MWGVTVKLIDRIRNVFTDELILPLDSFRPLMVSDRLPPVSVNGVRRSPHWMEFEKAYLHGKSCAGCGRIDTLSAHHMIPFHVDKSRELDVTNLLPLCYGPTFCHWVIGHCALSWECWHPDPVSEAKNAMQRFQQVRGVAKFLQRG
jgi:hypothetical protein